MKIIKAKNKNIIKLSQKEWTTIGEEAGWLKIAGPKERDNQSWTDWLLNTKPGMKEKQWGIRVFINDPDLSRFLEEKGKPTEITIEVGAPSEKKASQKLLEFFRERKARMELIPFLTKKLEFSRGKNRDDFVASNRAISRAFMNQDKEDSDSFIIQQGAESEEEVAIKDQRIKEDYDAALHNIKKEMEYIGGFSKEDFDRLEEANRNTIIRIDRTLKEVQGPARTDFVVDKINKLRPRPDKPRKTRTRNRQNVTRKPRQKPISMPAESIYISTDEIFNPENREGGEIWKFVEEVPQETLEEIVSKFNNGKISKKSFKMKVKKFI
jgi:hypothetical protein